MGKETVVPPRYTVAPPAVLRLHKLDAAIRLDVEDHVGRSGRQRVAQHDAGLGVGVVLSIPLTRATIWPSPLNGW